jgi:predicted glycogen debranching enzyme
MSNEIHLEANDTKAFEQALRTEWLLTNGCGGFAMGTAAGINTRRYHALLIGATQPPVGRLVALHSLIEQFEVDNRVAHLSTQLFTEQTQVHPNGWTRLRAFLVEPPSRCRWFFDVNGVRIVRTLTLGVGENVARVDYSIDGLTRPALLRVRPMMPLRDFHAVGHQGESTPWVSAGGRTLQIVHDDVTAEITRETGEWRFEPQWWNRLAYPHDRDRGQEWIEDVWSPGVIEFKVPLLTRRHEFSLRFSVEEEATRGVSVSTTSTPSESERVIDRLALAAAQFVVQRRTPDGFAPTIIAGYPWFADWGRDTMISLPGLLLCTERFDEAKQVLLAYGTRVRDGLLPNVFSDYDEGAAYNTADAALWFVHVVHEYARLSNDRDLDALLDACRAIIAGYREGTEFDVGLCEDDLITCGDGSDPITWMDAKRGGIAFTPRDGKVVEINALWHNALHCLAELTEDDADARELREAASRTAASFRARFWWPERNCLHDVLARANDWQPDGTVRPNQIFAVSLPFSPLERDQQRGVVDVVRDRLLTPFGLRTLDPDDPGYQPRFEGDLMQRDAAYHNGTVWPWLIGPYCEAVLRVNQFGDAAKDEVRGVITALIGELDSGCLNQVAEVYDGSVPQREAGCPAQAWSVAELLRIISLVDGVAG